MRRLKNLNIIQLVINILLVIGEAIGLYFVITSAMSGGTSPVELLRFYTELTAIITGVVALMSIVPNIIGMKKKQNATPHWLFTLGYISAVMNILTLLVVAFILRPAMTQFDALFDVQSGSLFQHFLCPLLSLILFFFFAIASKAKFRQTFVPLLVTVTYAAAIVLGVVIIFYTQGAKAAHDFAPYPFFRILPGTDDPIHDGTNYLQNLGIAGIVLLMTYVICFVAWCVNRLMSLIVIGYNYQSGKKVVKTRRDEIDALGVDQENYTNVYHISYHDRRLKTWKVKSEGAKRAIKVFNTQKEAIEYANGQVKLHGGSIRIHSMVGRIRRDWQKNPRG
ncbi:MAG: DUF2188 domain-containing protein [Bacilli bacterium]|nr:DUF2188 domain-containing protein [Bacilli bacterium]